MSFLRSLRADLALQFRHGFYGVYVAVILVYGLLLRLIPAPHQDGLLALAVFSDPMVFGFYFAAAMLFMERRQGVLDALFVTPLSAERYIASKMASMAVLGSFGALGIAVFVRGAAAPVPAVLGAAVPTACFSTLAGVIVGSRFKDFFSFIGIGSLFMVPAALPALPLLGFPDHPLYLAVPGTSFLWLFEGAFAPISPWRTAYAWIVSTGLTALCFPWAAAALRKHVIAGIGGGR